MILNETFFLKNLVEWEKSINFAPDLRTLNNGIMKKFIMCVIMTLIMGCAFTSCHSSNEGSISDTDTTMIDSINVDSINADILYVCSCFMECED